MYDGWKIPSPVDIETTPYQPGDEITYLEAYNRVVTMNGGWDKWWKP